MSARRQEKLVQEIRAVRKLKPNKQCFDCTEKGPTYVCTNFNTFICTTCAGIHREFSHTVKSITMATFTPPEVDALKEGANGVAKKYWRAKWAERKCPTPSSSDAEAVREFIRKTYVEKTWVKKASKKKKKKKKKKKYLDSDDDEEDEDEEEDEDVSYETKRQQRKAKKKTGGRRRKSVTKDHTPKKAPAPIAASAPVAAAPIGGINIASLFGDDEPSQPAQLAPNTTVTTAPAIQQQASTESWGDDWADFGQATPQYANAPAPAPAPAPTAVPVVNNSQLSQAFANANGNSSAGVKDIADQFSAFQILTTPPENQHPTTKTESKEKQPKSPLGLHERLDDPFGDILGSSPGNTPSPLDGGSRESTVDPNASVFSRSSISPGLSSRNPANRSSPRVSPAPAPTSVPAISAGNPFANNGMQGMGYGGMYPQNQQYNQQMAMMMQQQQYMMMMQQRQMMMRMAQSQQQQRGQNWGNQLSNNQGTPSGNQSAGGNIDIGNPFL
mmetsp:Transcript_28449/g.69352  ORF Transcript_28449/g.69352 Transcript_28449/m.69352 type:complete len:500 (+) Transcript_28449:187-1686(+)|eukprot:CAMPEP_0114510176 /NCGR_PEP_ID=MMETSP0109-20121206/13635_1 /TAXON_ID=29199 /ORGANISM="Chlorarachnion reptans, Strain CCCM449" /LENGTH=499 /DNA_ID=CAMNT_0001689441 /DNA_START=194 /DNA_END=1693 /DNA_ORIENTATION=+